MLHVLLIGNIQFQGRMRRKESSNCIMMKLVGLNFFKIQNGNEENSLRLCVILTYANHDEIIALLTNEDS